MAKRQGSLSWVAAMEILLTVLEDGTEKGKLMAREELRQLARDVDRMNNA